MPKFAYTVRDSQDSILNGTIDGNSVDGKRVQGEGRQRVDPP